MKRTLWAFATTLALAGAIFLAMGTSVKAGGAPGAPALHPQEQSGMPAAGPAGQGKMRAEKGERHPEIRAAIMHLRQAKAALEKGAHDFGGHRVAALEHTNKALEECAEALKFDREHPESK